MSAAVAAGMGLMTGLPPELAAKYRALVPHIEFSDAAKDEAVLIIRRIMQAGIAIAWGVDSTQLALNQQFSKASLLDSDCASLDFHEKIETVDPVCGGAKKDIEPKEYAP
jgi:hypothetical protein